MFIKIGERIVALDAIACIDPNSRDVPGRGKTAIHLKGGQSFTVDDETAEKLKEFFRVDASFDHVRDLANPNIPLIMPCVAAMPIQPETSPTGIQPPSYTIAAPVLPNAATLAEFQKAVQSSSGDSEAVNRNLEESRCCPNCGHLIAMLSNSAR